MRPFQSIPFTRHFPLHLSTYCRQKSHRRRCLFVSSHEVYFSGRFRAWQVIIISTCGMKGYCIFFFVLFSHERRNGLPPNRSTLHGLLLRFSLFWFATGHNGAGISTLGLACFFKLSFRGLADNCI